MAYETPSIIQNQLDHLSTKDRTLERRMELLELKLDQLMIMLKMILEKSVNPHRAKGKEVKMSDIIQFMEKLVTKQEQEDVTFREPADLVAELIKKRGGCVRNSETENPRHDTV